MDRINQKIASELGVAVDQVFAAASLLRDGATVPFIARYRKEKTGGLDDTQLRKLETRLGYLSELEDRRATVLRSIEEQGKLTPELARLINAAEAKVELEDLYAPYKPKRRSKAQMARAAGLEPLADRLLHNPALDPMAEAGNFVAAAKGVADAKAALDGARQILLERIGETAKLVGDLREWQWQEGVLAAKVAKGKDAEGAKFSDYFAFNQKIKDLPSHRALALLRGFHEDILTLDLDVPHDANRDASGRRQDPTGVRHRRPGQARRRLVARDRASGVAVQARRFPANRSHGSAQGARGRGGHPGLRHEFKDLLLAAPAGARVTMGLDPGFRTGVKVAVVDATGRRL